MLETKPANLLNKGDVLIAWPDQNYRCPVVVDFTWEGTNFIGVRVYDPDDPTPFLMYLDPNATVTYKAA